MKIRLDNILEKCGITLILAIIYFISIIPINTRIVMVTGAFFLMACNLIFVKKRIYFMRLDFFWLLTVLIILLRNKGYGGTLSYVCFYIVGLFLLFQKDKKYDENSFVVAVIAVMGKFFSLVTCLQFILPDLYDTFVKPMLIRTESDTLDMAVGIYLAGFTNQVAINAVYILFGIMAIIFSGNVRKKKSSIVWIFIELIALLLTGKRMSIVFGVIAILIALVQKEKFSKKVKRIIIYGLITLVVFGVVLFAVPQTRETLMRFFINTGSINEYSSGRVLLYEYALQMFGEKPLWGNGWFAYSTDIIRFWGKRIHTHNIYLQLLCETGVVGFLVFVVAMFGSFAYTAKKVKSAVEDKQIRYLRFSLAVQAFYLLYGITGNPIYDTYNILLYFLAIFIAYRAEAKGVRG